MPLGHRVSKDVVDRFNADRELAATYSGKLAAVVESERALRDAEAGGRPQAELRELAKAMDRALMDALVAAEAAERAAMGVKTYASDEAKSVRTAEIAARKARARVAVRPWTGEVDRLRTAREELKLSFRAVARG